MGDKKVIIYTNSYLSLCRRAKEYLSQKGISYTEHNIAQDRDKVKEMIQKSGQMAVPVIIIDGEIVVGFDQAKLDELLL